MKKNEELRMCLLNNWLEKDDCRCITVIGSGGKTTLIWHLASSLAPGRKILVTPTTKMFVPPPGEKLYDNYCGQGSLPVSPLPGVTLAGAFNGASGKLENLPPGQLEEMVHGYDFVLIEGDGSKGRPLKAWSDDEPVVPDFTDMTIGVLPLWPLGKPVSESLVHRMPLFLALTGAAIGEPITPGHILRVIMGRAAGEAGNVGSTQPGLFAKARGKKLLFFSQVEDDAAIKQARELAEALPEGFRCRLSGIVAGSVKRTLGQTISPANTGIQ